MRNTGNSHYQVAWFEERIGYLAEFMTPARLDTLKKVIGMRTKYMTICMENTFHPQNASALVRHCDAFGLQDIHTIEEACRFRPNVNIVKGTDKWITFHRHNSTEQALTSLKSAGYRIVATTPHHGDTTPEKFDVTSSPFALIFGTEHAGISEEVMESADEFIRIPMQGFVESLNVSASAAIFLYMLSQKVREHCQSWELSPLEKAEILFKWSMETVKDSKRILDKAGL